MYLSNKLSEIGRVLKEQQYENDQLGVLSGVSGIILFHFYYSKFLNTDEHANIGLQILTHCLEKINKGKTYPTYCAGLAGVGWTFNHLEQEGFIELDDELLTALDTPLYNVMISNMKVGNYDFLHGAIGYGFYFFKRYKNTKSEKLKMQYKNYLFTLIDLLNDLSKKEGEKTKWISVIDKETDTNGYNLSLSHGMSSIVNFLSRLYIYDDFRDNVKSMLKGGVNYTLSFMSKNEKSFSLFPDHIRKDKGVNRKSRVAWCYGDLGIALSLWHASKSLNDDQLKSTTINILKHVSRRTSIEDSLIMDASICHGSFGNAQVFNYMYKETKEETFKMASSFWTQDGLEKAVHKNGYCGYKQWSGIDEKWQKKLFLLDGISGIGLCLISHLSQSEINWDECLMIS